MIKILSIGNSFSEDSTALIELLSPDIYVRNLFIGGCSLSRHAENIQNDTAAYEYQHNGGGESAQPISILSAIKKENWDYITVQQVSQLSGVEDSYFPYINQLLDFIKQNSTAQIVFHQTWAYEKNSQHSGFANYNCAQDTMEKAISKTTKSVCDKLGLSYIPVGEVIAKLRKSSTFDIDRGGISLLRDGFHLNLSYGRLAAAATWIKYFTGKLPTYLSRTDLSSPLKEIIEVLSSL